jgi:hypothetical protein
MPEPHTSQSFPLSQRELVGLALSRGRRPGTPPATRDSQRDRVHRALALGFSGTPKGAGRGARPGIYR